MSMFSDLGEADGGHWVMTATEKDPPEDSERETRHSVYSSGVRQGAFDPAVSRPDSRVCGTSSPDTLLARAASMSRTSLSSEDTSHCKVCDVPLSGIEPAKQHYAGKQHKKALQRALIQQEAMTKQGAVEKVPLHCDVCMKDFSGEIPAVQHYESKLHKKAVEGAKKWATSQTEQVPTSPPKEKLQAASEKENPALAFSAPFSLFSEGKGQLADLTKIVDPGKSLSSPRAAIAVRPAESTRDDGIRFTGGSSSVSGAKSKVPVETSRGSTSNLLIPQGPALNGMSAEDRDILRRKVIVLCTTTLEDTMRQIIPQVANQIADVVLEELHSRSTSTTSNLLDRPCMISRDDAFTERSNQGSLNPGQKEDVHPLNSDQSYTGMPKLIDTADDPSIISSQWSLDSSMNDLSKTTNTNDAYSETWNSLTQKKKGGSP